jgi:hypothetical protein
MYNLRHREAAILDIAMPMQLPLTDLPEFPPQHPRSPTEARLDFHLAEYQALRQEILHHTSVNDQVERYAILGGAALYAWVLSKEAAELNLLVRHGVVALPPVLVALSWLASARRHRRILEIGSYLSELEELFVGADPSLAPVPGWEHRLAEIRHASRDPLGGDRMFRWGLYLELSCIASVIVAILGG